MISVKPSCLQNGFIQQLLGADTETHSKTLGGARGTLRMRARKDYRNQRGCGRHGPQNQLSRAQRGLQRLKQHTRSLHGSKLGPLHIPMVVKFGVPLVDLDSCLYLGPFSSYEVASSSLDMRV